MEQEVELDLIVENFSQDVYDTFMADVQLRKETSPVVQLAAAVKIALREEDIALTRLVITGDLVASVSTREDRSGREFTVDRGAGTVAAKTMPPNSEGIVDILIPVYWLLPNDDGTPSAERNQYLKHIAAHEAVHASIHHNGDEPFDLHRREEFGHAMMNFVSMASEQIEEHLAEYLSSQVSGRALAQNADGVSASVEAWQNTLSIRLPAIPEDADDYFQRGMLVTFEALHVLWKTLAYMAAALRQVDTFDPVPNEIANLPAWRKFIEPWWDQYVELLGLIPMSLSIDIEVTDEVVRALAVHLQQWANDIGFDFHDTPKGGFFRIKIWD